MYVHIGKELIIPENEIITILDLEKMLENKNLEDILKELNLENNIINIFYLILSDEIAYKLFFNNFFLLLGLCCVFCLFGFGFVFFFF